METKYGNIITIGIMLVNHLNTINTWHTKIITMEAKYGKRMPLTNDIPTLLQWKQNMERDTINGIDIP